MLSEPTKKKSALEFPPDFATRSFFDAFGWALFG